MSSFRYSDQSCPPSKEVSVLPCLLAAWHTGQAIHANKEEKMLGMLLNQQVQRCIEHAHQYWPDLPMPAVMLDLKGRSAGQVHFGRSALRFNQAMLVAQPCDFLEEVVPHEVAHWVDVYGLRSGGKPHGAAWRWIMTSLYGREPRVTHRFDTSVTSPAPWHYACACPKGHRLTTRRHLRIKRGYVYCCRCCGQQLRALGCEARA